MKITDITTHLLGVHGRNIVLVRVSTDAGIEGIGEAFSVGPDRATAAAVEHLALWLRGEDPFRIEHLWQTMYNFGRFPGGSVINAAISGIEQALWDITGKALGVPVHVLLGGRCRDRVLVYQGCGGDTPEDLAQGARLLVGKYGYKALKIGPFPPDADTTPWGEVLEAAGARMAAVRAAVGPGVEIGVDCHARLAAPIRAIELCRALEPYRPAFVEEPLRPENVEALAQVRAKAGVPIATGEMLYTKFQFRDLLMHEAADIIQPDVCCAGGLLECRKIAAMAEAFYVPLAPHNPMGPVATAVNVHLTAVIPNFLMLEYIPDDTPPRSEIVTRPMVVEDGYIPVPDTPGLGIELNEEALSRYPAVTWHRGFSYNEDGSVALI